METCRRWGREGRSYPRSLLKFHRIYIVYVLFMAINSQKNFTWNSNILLLQEKHTNNFHVVCNFHDKKSTKSFIHPSHQGMCLYCLYLQSHLSNISFTISAVTSSNTFFFQFYFQLLCHKSTEKIMRKM